MANNREYVSDVFSMLMEYPEYALNVYNGVNGTNYQNPAEVEICVLEKGISLSVRNDASFIVSADLNMYEHQNTYNPNMALRQLFYLVDVLKKKTKDMDLYGRKQIKIPTPRFAVFYTGKEKRKDVEIFKLSDLFENKMVSPEIELTCISYNISGDKNNKLLEGSSILKEFATFIEKVREGEKHGNENYLSDAIEWCINNNVLKTFLEERKDEVMKAMIVDMTFEKREALIRRDEREEGIKEALISLVKDGLLAKDVAAQRLNVTVEELEKMLN